jgi:RimJ/RimL family protein N-acetyltransferase
VSVLETERLILRHLEEDDAPFILNLLNQPSFLRFIGDKGVRNLDQAREYMLSGPVASYAQHGYGLYLTQLRDGTPIGMCGLVRREVLDHPDVGYAFLPEYWSQGYAFEAARAVMVYAREGLKLGMILAIVSPDNESSIRLLNRLGLRFERTLRLKDEADEVSLFGLPEGGSSAGKE